MKNLSVPNPEKSGPTWTILDLLNWTSSYFTAHKIEQPRATAEVLLAHTLGFQRIDLYLRYDQPLHRDELSRFKSFVKRRVSAEPVAYITGEKEFWSLTLSVNSNVLIPRPESENLVEAALKRLPEKTRKGACRILDLGTGSGAIAIALAFERPQTLCFAVDRSPAAVQLARKNADRHGLASRVHFFAGDWFSSIRSGAVFDIIVSNPPYIKTQEIEGLQPEIVRYEPHGALDGGPLGLDALSCIIRRAPPFLAPNGALILEIGYDQKAPLIEMVSHSKGYEAPLFFKDYAGHDRILLLTRLVD
ncbi:MAG: peptide chain release factor N(5)-glutamine methyltransferase [Desulfobacterales bacterium]|jgi:release factor glutamine methyltransferase|nr:peptide chain release factor N(5)-glutamine methyltransferase [Desulfobacterales bacterium]